MAETIQDGKWHWYSVRNDLVQQGGLDEEEIVIEPFSSAHDTVGRFKDYRFVITWIKDTFLLLSMAQLDQELVDAFSDVVEYKPFARYERDGYTTVEWDKVEPDGRWVDLQGEKNLQRLDNG